MGSAEKASKREVAKAKNKERGGEREKDRIRWSKKKEKQGRKIEHEVAKDKE